MKRTYYAFVGAVMFLMSAATQAVAGDVTTGSLDLYPSNYDINHMLLAQNDTGTQPQSTSAVQQDPFEESAFTANKMHGYLGIASLTAALLAGVTAPDNEGVAAGQPIKKGFHHYAGLTAAALGGAAVVSGLMLHADDLTPDFLDPDTAHMILGILGTAAYAYAVSKGPKVTGKGAGGHAAAGMAGAALMATAIYLEF